MPLVQVRYANVALALLGRNVSRILPEIIAPALDVSEHEGESGIVLPGDVIVWCSKSEACEVNGKDLEIFVTAQDSPFRNTTLKRRADEILEGIQPHLDKVKINPKKKLTRLVWIMLLPTACATL